MIYLGKTVFTYGVRCCRDIFMFAMMDTEKNGIRHYYVDKSSNQLDKIVSSLMCDGVCWITYNGQYYDSTILNYVIANYKDLSVKPASEIAYLIYSFSLTVKNDPVQNWVGYKHANKFLCVDLAPMFFKVTPKSFGEAKASLKMRDPREREVDIKLAFSSRKSLMMKYLSLDLKEYYEMFVSKHEEISFREFILNEYGMNLLNLNSSGLAMNLFNGFYCANLGRREELKGIDRTRIDFRDFLPYIDSFDGLVDKRLYSRLENISFTSEDNNTIDIPILSIDARLTGSGLKGFKGKGVFKSAGKKNIYYADMYSAWPSVMLKYGIHPEQTDPKAFEKTMRTFFELRENTIYKNGFKNVMNSIIGNFKVKESIVHDYKAFIEIRIISALESITMFNVLSELPGFEMIQINNDGIVFSCDLPYNNVRYILSEWESKRRLKVKLERYDMFAQYSINDWFSYTDGKIPDTKGIFESGSDKYPLCVCGAAMWAITDNQSIDNAVSRIPKQNYPTSKSLPDGDEFVIKEGDVFVRLGKIANIYKSSKPKELYRFSYKDDRIHLYDSNSGLSTDKNMNIDYKWYAVKAYQLYTELTTKQLELF